MSNKRFKSLKYSVKGQCPNHNYGSPASSEYQSDSASYLGTFDLHGRDIVSGKKQFKIV